MAVQAHMTPTRFLRLVEAEDEEDQREEFTIRGEYWLSKDGTNEYCDGDVGDANHESVVMSQLMSQIAGACDGIQGDELDWNGLWIEVADNVDDTARQGDAVRFAGWARKPADDVVTEHIRERVTNEFGPQLGRAMLDAATGHGDLREFAMRWWDEMTVHGNSIGLFRITPDTLKAIYDGVSTIVWEETGEDSANYHINLHIRDFSGKSFSGELQELKDGGLHREAVPHAPTGSVNAQVRQMDQQTMHPYYRGHTGD